MIFSHRASMRALLVVGAVFALATCLPAESVRQEARPAIAAGVGARDLPPPTGGWTLVVVGGPDENPLSEAEVTLQDPAAAAPWPHPLWRGFAVDRIPTTRGTTNAHGVCRLPTHSGRGVRLCIRAEGWATMTQCLPSPEAGTRRTVSLARPFVSTLEVVDAATREPVEGASVVLVPTAPDVRESRRIPAELHEAVQLWADLPRTDVAGRVILQAAEPGYYQVMVCRAGYQSHTIPSIEFPFDPAPRAVALDPGYSVTAAATNEDGDPLVGWQVSFVVGSGGRLNFRDLDSRFDPREWRVVTDEAGRATSPGVGANEKVVCRLRDPSGTSDYDLMTGTVLRSLARCTTPVFAPVRLVGFDPKVSSLQVRWSPTQDEDILELELFCPGWDVPPQFRGRERARGSAGRATLGIPAHWVDETLRVQALGSHSGVWRSNSLRPHKTDDVELLETNPRAHAVHGQVLGSDGEPAVGAEVALSSLARDLGLEAPGRDSRLLPLARCRTDQAGRFRCDRLPNGPLVVDVRTTRGERAVLRRAVPGDGQKIEVQTAAAGAVQGMVRGAGEAPLQVVARNTALSLVYRVPAAPDGTFSFQGLPAASYEVSAWWIGPSACRPVPHRGDTPCEIVLVGSGTIAACILDRSRIVRDVTIEVVGTAVGTALEVVLERLHPHDRMGAEVWTMHQRVPRSGMVHLRSVPGDADYGVSLRPLDERHLLCWSHVPRTGHARISFPVRPGVDVEVTGYDSALGLALVPISLDGTMLRESPIEPTKAMNEKLVFERVPRGSYRVASGLIGSHVGRVDASMDIAVEATPVRLDWSPSPRR